MKDEKNAKPQAASGSSVILHPSSLTFDAAIFGLIVADLIAQPMDLRDPPAPGGLAKLNSLQLATGGNVCNVGIAMARLGAKVAAAGAIGDDTLGAALVEKMRGGGVDAASVAIIPGGQTSATVVAVEPGGERCFFHTAGVCAGLDADSFRNSSDLFSRCRILQIGYFGLLPALTADLPDLLGELKKRAPKLLIALDTVNPPAERRLLGPILEHVDIFCPSRPEAAFLTEENDPTKMIAAFRRHMPRGLIAVKLDSQGCLLDEGAAQTFVPAYKIKVVDTTGAGDTWFAGLLVGLLRGMPLEQMGRLANRAAADCCTALGASTGVQSFEQTLARI